MIAGGSRNWLPTGSGNSTKKVIVKCGAGTIDERVCRRRATQNGERSSRMRRGMRCSTMPVSAIASANGIALPSMIGTSSASSRDDGVVDVHAGERGEDVLDRVDLGGRRSERRAADGRAHGLVRGGDARAVGEQKRKTGVGRRGR